MTIRFAAVSLAAVAMFASMAQAANTGADLVSHRAIYKMALATSKSGSGVTGASGAMSYKFGDSCDGWTVENKTALSFAYSDGAPVSTTWDFVTWESKDGLHYRFRVRSTRDGVVNEEIDGVADLDGQGQGRPRQIHAAGSQDPEAAQRHAVSDRTYGPHDRAGSAGRASGRTDLVRRHRHRPGFRRFGDHRQGGADRQGVERARDSGRQSQIAECRLMADANGLLPRRQRRSRARLRSRRTLLPERRRRRGAAILRQFQPEGHLGKTGTPGPSRIANLSSAPSPACCRSRLAAKRPAPRSVSASARDRRCGPCWRRCPLS